MNHIELNKEQEIMECEKAIETIRDISKANEEVDQYHLWVAFNALDYRIPKNILWRHKEGENSALFICPECDRRVIVNYQLQTENYKDWYCKECGQALKWEKGDGRVEEVNGNK